MACRIIHILLPIFGVTLCDAQISFTRYFTNKLSEAGAKINIADDNWFKVTLCENGKLSYDLCVESPRDSAELKYIVYPDKEGAKILFPEVHFVSKIANIAANDDTHWIRTKSFSQRIIEDSLHADWAGELSFYPNKSLTDKKYAKAFALYKQDYGMIYAILFYNFEFPHFNEQLHSITFVKNF